MDFATAWTTLALGATAACIALPLGVAMVSVLQRRGVIGRVMLITMAGLLFFPLFLHVSLWDAAFGKLGWLTSTGGQVLTPIVSGWTAAAWIHGVAAAPQVAVIFLLGIATGQRTHEEQASLDAGPLSVLVHIKIWRLLPLGVLATLWVMVTVSREIAATDIYQIGTLAEQVYLGYSLGAVGSAAGNWTPDQLVAASEFQIGTTLLPFFFLALVVAYAFTRLTSPDPSIDSWRPTMRRPSHAGWSMLGCVLLALLVVIPFANVLYRCGYQVRPIDGIAVAGFSWQQLGHSLGRAGTNFRGEFFWSTTIAMVAATSILLTAVAINWLASGHGLSRIIFVGLVAVCLTLPGPLIGTTIVWAFSDVQQPAMVWLYDRTIFAPTLATAIFCWPLAAMLVRYLFSRIDHDALTHAQLDGANAFDRLWQFGVCGNARALAGCWLVTFSMCFGELSAAQLVLPPGMDTLPRLMLGLLHAGVDEMTAALAIVIGATTMAISLLAFAVGSRWLETR